LEKRIGSITIGLSEADRANAGERNPISDVRELGSTPSELDAPTVRKPPPLDAIRRARQKSHDSADESLLEPDSEALTPPIPRTIVGAPLPAALRAEGPRAPSRSPDKSVPISLKPPVAAGGAPAQHSPNSASSPSGAASPDGAANPNGASGNGPDGASSSKGVASMRPTEVSEKRDGGTLTSPAYSPLPRAPRPHVTLPDLPPSVPAPRYEVSPSELRTPSEVRGTTPRPELAELRAEIDRVSRESNRASTIRLMSVATLAGALALALGYVLGSSSRTIDAESDASSGRELSPQEQEALVSRAESPASSETLTSLRAELEATRKQLAALTEEKASLSRKSGLLAEPKSERDKASSDAAEKSVGAKSKLLTTPKDRAVPRTETPPARDASDDVSKAARVSDEAVSPAASSSPAPAAPDEPKAALVGDPPPRTESSPSSTPSDSGTSDPAAE
jgi:hypothetical protein